MLRTLVRQSAPWCVENGFMNPSGKNEPEKNLIKFIFFCTPGIRTHRYLEQHQDCGTNIACCSILCLYLIWVTDFGFNCVELVHDCGASKAFLPRWFPWPSESGRKTENKAARPPMFWQTRPPALFTALWELLSRPLLSFIYGNLWLLSLVISACIPIFKQTDPSNVN